MRRSVKLLVTLVLTAGLLAASALTASAVPSDPFVGHWQATDIDDSSLNLSISGGPHRVTLTDDNATGCLVDSPAVALGTGAVTDSAIDIEVQVRCIADGTVGPFSFTLTHDPITDTLDNGAGVIWSRAGA